MNIPPPYSKGKNANSDGMYAQIKLLSPGESIEWDQKAAERCAYAIALKFGYRIACRRLGRKDLVTIYRIS